MLAGLFIEKISAIAARATLVFGLAFYVLMTWGYTGHGIHFVHLWGIEFILNISLMYVVSHYFPRKNAYAIKHIGPVNLATWKHTKPMSIALCAATVMVYVLLGFMV